MREARCEAYDMLMHMPGTVLGTFTWYKLHTAKGTLAAEVTAGPSALITGDGAGARVGAMPGAILSCRLEGGPITRVASSGPGAAAGGML